MGREVGRDETHEIHICWKVERDARMEPPIQTVVRQGRVSDPVVGTVGITAYRSTCARGEQRS